MAISMHVQLSFIILLSATITKTNANLAQTKCLEHEKAVLLDLRNELVFDPSHSRKLLPWNLTDDCCSWEGVECDGSGHVIVLQLYDVEIADGFNGSLSLFRLEYLEKLDLSNTFLEGSQIPRDIHKLTRLTSLILTNCSLKGYFSQKIFQLPTLGYLDLSHNPSLSGTIPQIPQNNSFRTIVLADTNFSGSLPDSISNLERLTFLDLSLCRFTGPIPSTLGNLTQLKNLFLSHNFFTASISSIHFEPLSEVLSIDLSYNSLSGTIPISIFTLPSMWRLDLQENQFSGQVSEFPTVNTSALLSINFSCNRLESPIPNSFFKLQNLETLLLSDNQFNDNFQLKKFLSLPNKLGYLDLSSNNLSLDASSNNLSVKQSSLYGLKLSNNKIAGEIPSWIWEIGNGSLTYLHLASNMLVGLQKPYNFPASLSLDELDLHSNQIRGEFPTSLMKQAQYVDLSNNYFDKFNIGNFSAPSLYYFSLKNNSLSGSLTTFIPNATFLHILDLSDNNLIGSIPPRFFINFNSLQVLNLGRNNISGVIPDELFYPNNCILMSLDLSGNKLLGNVPLFLQNCSFLEVLNLSNNRLNGTVPASLTQLEHLAVLNLGGNNITGRIPNFTDHCPLQYMVLNNNNLKGEVPRSLENCRQLEVMNVGGNHIDGIFPCMLPLSLRVLVLSSNRFHGEIRCHNTTWPNLQIIDIAHNKISGYMDRLNLSSWSGMMRDTVTTLSYVNLGYTMFTSSGYYREEVALTIKGLELKLVKIWPDFTSIDFSSNNFRGDIPDTIGKLNSLYLLNLSNNALTGNIPKSFGELRQLGALDLSMNQLTGKIPQEIAGLTFLVVMNVSHNKLIGQIPVGSQIQLFSADSFEGNKALCGVPLNNSCTNTTSVPAATLPNMETDTEDIKWDFILGAAGYVVGLGIISWLLLFCPSFRNKYFEKVEDVFEKIFSFCQHKKRRDKGRRVVRNPVRKQ